MKKMTMALLALFAAGTLTCGAQQVRRGPAPKQLITCAASANKMYGDQVGQKVLLVDEDFSGLIKGTEEEFDPELICDDMGWILDGLLKPYDKSCTKPWGGMGLYSAGGTIAVSNGFLNTPTGDYSGTLKMTCRVRIPKGQVITDWYGDEMENPPLDIVLLRRSALVDYKRITVNLTEEWQEITFEADNGWFNDCMIQFFTPYNFTFLVDDVRIEHEITSIETPHAKPATTLADNLFRANWDGTSSADEYLLSVYTKKENPDVNEVKGDFETINSKDGKMIDETNPGYPEGWEIGVTQNGDERHIFTEPGMFSSGKQSLCLDASGDYIMTPASEYPITGGQYWINIDDSQMADGDQSNSVLTMQIYDGSQWLDLFYLSVEAARQYPEGVVVDCAEYIPLVKQVYQMRMVLNKDADDKCLVAIDDFNYSAPGFPIKEYFFEDKVIPLADSCSYEVTVPDPNAEYFYYVKARNEVFTSEASDEIEVFDVHEPVALPATNVTDHSYVANWECGPKSDFFTVKQYLGHKADEDVNDFVVLEEDFSKVVSTGTPESPEAGQMNEGFVSIDQYTKIPGWTASSYVFADGMLGGTSADYPYMPGAINLPTMDLSHNNGECKVTIRAYAEAGDWLIIGGNSQVTVAAIEFVETGMVEKTLDLIGCSDAEELQIYTQSYGNFMLDYIKITQPMKAGDEVSILTKTQVTDNPEDRSIAFEDVNFWDGYTVGYNVTAHRYYHGNEKEIWQSFPSERMIVDNNATGIGCIENQMPESIKVVEGGIYFNMADAAEVRVYDFTGCLVKSERLAAGQNFMSLANGAYIVAVPGGKAKVVIR